MKFLSTSLGLTIALLLWLSGVVSANPVITVGEGREIDLYSLCSKFPHNSRCKGYQIPIALQDRAGDEGICSLVSGNINEFSKCKVLFTEKQLSVYLEEGKRLEILDDRRTTREITIPLNNIASFNYFESEKDNSGMMIGLFGLIGAAFSNSEPFSEIEISFKSESDLDSPTLDYVTILLDHSQGVALRNSLEQLIGNELQLSYPLPSSGQPETATAQLALRRQLLTTNECVGCDLRGVDLRQANLKDANLERANLERANLSEANLSNANLKGSNLRGANLEQAILRDADLSTEFLQRTNLQNANFSHADLSQARLNGANLEKVNLSNANLKNADLGNAYVNHQGDSYKFSTHLKGANLVNADLSDANLEQACLVNANLNGANLSNSDLHNSNLCGATMPDGSSSSIGCN